MGIRYNFLRFPGGKAKAVTLSYDDGSEHEPRLIETINKYGLKCTFNLIGERVVEGNPLSVDYIKENILAHGHEIATHGYLHRAHNKIRPISGIRDTLDCRLALEQTFNMIIRGMAFPDCSVNRFTQPDIYEKVKEYISDLDIAYIRTSGGDNDRFLLPDDWYNWFATAHHNNPKIMEYIDSFISLNVEDKYIASRDPRLFFLWGHAFEFENKKNWDHLEEICQKLSGKDDIWYATNIEIHDYVEAYRHLRYSADESIIYNPTLLDIWLDIDKKPYLVKSGQTIIVE